MLSVEEAIRARRSIRKFKPDPVSEEIVIQLLEAARLAPSAANTQPWRFLVVRDKEAKKELRRVCWGQAFVEEAPLDIVCFGDLDRYVPIRNAPFHYNKYLGPGATPIQDRISFLTSNVAIPVTQMALMATALGLGTTVVGGFDEASDFNRLFNLPENLVVVAVLPVGYPAENPSARPRRSLAEIIIVPDGSL
jgi:nitroreductase